MAFCSKDGVYLVTVLSLFPELSSQIDLCPSFRAHLTALLESIALDMLEIARKDVRTRV